MTSVQCYADGMTDDRLRGLLRRDGEWVTVRRGVYLPRAAWESVPDGPARWSLRDRAASLAMETEHVLSHDSAARALGVPMLRPERPLVHVTRHHVGGTRTTAGVKHHLTRVDLEPLVVDGLRVTAPARTALDLAREHGVQAGVVAMDHLLAQGTTRRELRRELETMWCWPHVRSARAAVDLADGRAETPLESLLRLLLLEAGFVDIDVQWPVVVGGSVRWIDLRVGNHLFEGDGLLKLLTPADGGIATSTRTALREQLRRQTDVCALGLGMSRVLWDDHFGRARAGTIARLRADEAVTRQRYGPTLPAHLAEQAARIRRDHPRRRPA